MLLWELPPGFFALSGLSYDSEHSFVLAKSLSCIFSRASQNSYVAFYRFSFWFWIFQRHKGFAKLYLQYLRDPYWFFPLFLHLCQVLELSLSDQSQNLHLLIPCWFPKYYLGYLPVYCHNWGKTDPVIIFMFWLITTWPYLSFFPLVSLNSRGINLNFFVFSFSALTAPKVQFLNLTTFQSLLSYHQMVYLS